MTPSARLAAAYALDWLAGDPAWLPHPVRGIGAAVAAGERRLPRTMGAGAVLTAAIIAGSWLVSRSLCQAGAAAEILLGWMALATRSLLDESGVVVEAVEAADLPLARRRLARIVGRDTGELDEAEILRAVIETVAEGLCDGVVAPLFYLALGGVPAAYAYKAVNTLDSMIGHPEPPYTLFGRVAARLDDGANFLPARLAAFAIVAASGNAANAWRVWLADGAKHPSPNAGHTEAAMAGALGVKLGGTNYYGGEPSPKPVLGAGGRRPAAADARRALQIAGVASIAVFTAAWLFVRWKERA
jgi:adenosylcobinamide-phosphate synthase